MIVFIVMYGDYDGGGCCSIWSTREAALKDVKVLYEKYHYPSGTLYIESWEIDKGVINHEDC